MRQVQYQSRSDPILPPAGPEQWQGLTQQPRVIKAALSSALLVVSCVIPPLSIATPLPVVMTEQSQAQRVSTFTGPTLVQSLVQSTVPIPQVYWPAPRGRINPAGTLWVSPISQDAGTVAPPPPPPVTSATSKSSLQSLLSGEPLPTRPAIVTSWDSDRIQVEYTRFFDQLLDYIRRLIGKLTATNIVNEINIEGVDVSVLTGWQYNATTHHFEYKTRTVKVISALAESAFTLAAGTQPTSVTNLTDWQYDSTTHKFQVKSRAEYVLEAAAASAFTNTSGTHPSAAAVVSDWQYDSSGHKFQQNLRTIYSLETGALAGLANTSGGQPVEIVRLDTNVDYSTSTHVLSEDIIENVWVLNKGSATTGVNIDTAESCT